MTNLNEFLREKLIANNNLVRFFEIVFLGFIEKK
jgi:hypothetical protein